MSTWKTRLNPTYSDVLENKCSYFLTVCEFSNVVNRSYFDMQTGRWYSDHYLTKPIHVFAWNFLPTFDYDEIRSVTQLKSVNFKR